MDSRYTPGSGRAYPLDIATNFQHHLVKIRNSFFFVTSPNGFSPKGFTFPVSKDGWKVRKFDNQDAGPRGWNVDKVTKALTSEAESVTQILPFENSVQYKILGETSTLSV